MSRTPTCQWLALLIATPAVLLGCRTDQTITTEAPAADIGPLDVVTPPLSAPVTVGLVTTQLPPDETGEHNRHADLAPMLNSEDVQELQLAWKIDTGANVSHMPLVRDGKVYFADWGGKCYAADEASGQVLWQKQVAQPQTAWPWHGFAGTGTLGDGLLFEASVEGVAYALDVENGEIRWETEFTDDPEAGNCGNLLYHDGLLYIPVSSVEEPLTKSKPGFKPDFRGEVVALDARSGKQVWERELVESPQNGVAVWSGFALDAELGLLYFTTGNNYTGVATVLSDSLIAVNAKTGRIVWARQATPHDVWTMAEPIGSDYDFAAAPQLFQAMIGGEVRRLVGAGQKSGRFWALDRETGESLWSTIVGYGNVGGGIHAAASIGVGRIYVWGNNAYPYKYPADHPMDVKCVDAASGRYVWSRSKAQPAALSSAGFLANDVYLVGSLDGKIRAYAADGGKTLWTSQQTAPIASSLLVTERGTLLFGTGVPKHFGGGEGGGGLFAFTRAGKGDFAASAGEAKTAAGSQKTDAKP